MSENENLTEDQKQNLEELNEAGFCVLQAFTNCVNNDPEKKGLIVVQALSLIESVIISSIAKNFANENFIDAINVFSKSLKLNALTIERQIATGELEI